MIDYLELFGLNLNLPIDFQGLNDPANDPKPEPEDEEPTTRDVYYNHVLGATIQEFE